MSLTVICLEIPPEGAVTYGEPTLEQVSPLQSVDDSGGAHIHTVAGRELMLKEVNVLRRKLQPVERSPSRSWFLAGATAWWS